MGRAFTSAALQGKMEIVTHTVVPKKIGGQENCKQKIQNTEIYIFKTNKQTKNSLNS